MSAHFPGIEPNQALHGFRIVHGRLEMRVFISFVPLEKHHDIRVQHHQFIHRQPEAAGTVFLGSVAGQMIDISLAYVCADQFILILRLLRQLQDQGHNAIPKIPRRRSGGIVAAVAHGKHRFHHQTAAFIQQTCQEFA